MKKFLSLALVAGMFVFAACESKPAEETVTTEVDTTTDEAETTTTIAEDTTGAAGAVTTTDTVTVAVPAR